MTALDLLPEMFAEFGHVLAPGGQVLLAFQVGDQRVHLDQAFGHTVSLDAYQLPPDRVAEFVTAAGLVVHTRVRREAAGRERTPQASDGEPTVSVVGGIACGVGVVGTRR